MISLRAEFVCGSIAVGSQVVDVNSPIITELTRLMSFGQGGADVADEPGNSKPPVEGQAVGGVDKAVEWFVEGLRDNSALRILFLIGAPGNGKSYWSGRAAEASGLRDTAPKDAKRQFRKHEYTDDAGEVKLRIINDASAPNLTRDPTDSTPTISDLAASIGADLPLLVNINRGVFFKELSKFQLDDASTDEKLASAVLRVLSGNNEFQDNLAGIGNITLRDSAGNHHETLVSLRVDRPNRIPIAVLAVQMDMHSIFARSLEYESDQSFFGVPSTKLGARSYEILSPSDLGFLDAANWESTPGGHLLKGVAELLASSGVGALGELNPIRANIEQLCSNTYFAGVSASLRSAELISSRHLAFRHLWTAINFLVLGDPRFGHGFKPLEALVGVDEKARQLPAHPKDRLTQLVDLAQLRFHQAIYGAKWSLNNVTDESLSWPQVEGSNDGSVLQVMMTCDPTLDNEKTTKMGLGAREWSRSVRDAFLGALTDTESPSIIESVFTASHDGQAAQKLVCPFDRALDEAILNVIRADQGERPIVSRRERDALLQWYGDYLTRLVAVSLGRTAWHHELEEFIRAWQDSQLQPNLSDTLHGKLMSYILPTYEGSNEANQRRLVSLLRSRTEPIRTSPDRPVIAYQLPARIMSSAKTRGDRLVVELLDLQARDPGGRSSVLFSLDLDVRLVRELNVREVAGGSCSDVSESILPVVERYRALATTKVRLWSLVTSEGVDIV